MMKYLNKRKQAMRIALILTVMMLAVEVMAGPTIDEMIVALEAEGVSDTEIKGMSNATNLFCNITTVCENDKCSYDVVDSGFTLTFSSSQVTHVEGPCAPIGGGKILNLTVIEKANGVNAQKVFLNCKLNEDSEWWYSINRLSGKFRRTGIYSSGSIVMDWGTCSATKQKF